MTEQEVDRRRNHGRTYVTNMIGDKRRIRRARRVFRCWSCNVAKMPGEEYVPLHLFEGGRARLCVDCFMAGKAPQQ